jgi:hypothetical protein
LTSEEIFCPVSPISISGGETGLFLFPEIDVVYKDEFKFDPDKVKPV